MKRVCLPKNLAQAMESSIAREKAKIKAVIAAKGDENLSTATVRQCYEGSRGITTMVYEPSLLDAQEGIRFRGLSIPECIERLPRAQGSNQPMPESMLWLLLVGTVPTEQQARELSRELVERMREHSSAQLAEAFVDSVAGTGLHPMSQLIAGSVLLGQDSKFAAAYSEGIKKPEYWRPCLDDSLDLIAALFRLTGVIYSSNYGKKVNRKTALRQTDGADLTAYLGRLMGIKSAEAIECLRLYLTIHVDHEGGNVSAHATQLVGSALSDPYLSYSAGMAGLAGPLHGLANQEVLTFYNQMLDEFRNNNFDVERASDADLLEKVTSFGQKVLDSGRVIPGFGHAVLRKTDPRYMIQREYAQKHLPKYPLFRIASAAFQAFPEILTKQGKTKNPWPNVDAHSGVLLQYHDIKEENFYTVLFGLSRAIGVLSALTWNRAVGTPIERPKSVTTEWIIKKFNIDTSAAENAIPKPAQ